MHTKLTLRLDDELIRRAKSFAKKTGKPISRIVADYFALLKERPTQKGTPSLTPLVRSLKGILRGTRLEQKDYKRYLEKKHLSRHAL